MSWEDIGSISTGEMPEDQKWIVFGLGLAKKFVSYVCGDPPPGCKLDIMWHEHELGSYPSLGVWSDGDPPGHYVSSCERALEVFDEAVSWHNLKEHMEEEALLDAESDDDIEDAGLEEDSDDEPETDDGESEGSSASWQVSTRDDAEQALANQIVPAQVESSQPQFAQGVQKCHLCGCLLDQRGLFVDGRLRGRADWANMCAPCFFEHGDTIGWGNGLLYARQLNGMWRLVAGFR